MIRNRLAELLAERGLKISRVATEIPNLSRNTITSTSQNSGKMNDATLISIPIHPGELAIDVYIKVESAKSKPLVFGYSGEVSNKTYWGATLEFNLKKDDQNDFKSVWNDKITPGFRGTIWWKIKQKIADALNNDMQERFSNGDYSAANVPIDSGVVILTTDFETDEIDLNGLPF